MDGFSTISSNPAGLITSLPGVLPTILYGYLWGSIPFGLVLCKLAGLGDIRKIGSGNIGATNVLRTGNKPLALATLLLDSGKGAIAILSFIAISNLMVQLSITSAIYAEIPWSSNYAILIGMLVGLGAIIGHCYPIWLKFKGGKGVATTLGTLLAAIPLVGLSACAIWLVSALIFRISSLAALIAVGLSPVIAHYLYNDPNLSSLCAAIAALVFWKHRENIHRIFAGTEPKIGAKKKGTKKKGRAKT